MVATSLRFGYVSRAMLCALLSCAYGNEITRPRRSAARPRAADEKRKAQASWQQDATPDVTNSCCPVIAAGNVMTRPVIEVTHLVVASKELLRGAGLWVRRGSGWHGR
jgi:hypothetical protein